MPTVIRSTITRMVRAQTQTRGVCVGGGDCMSVGARCHKPGGARGGESAELLRGREAESQCEGKSRHGGVYFTGEAHFGAHQRACASLFS